MTLQRPCARCGQPCDVLGDGYALRAGRPVHTACGADADGQRREFVTVAEAAEILRVSDKTIRRYIGSGMLAARRLPGGPHSTLLIAPADLRSLLDREAAGAAQDLREALQTLVTSHGWQRVEDALQEMRNEE